MTSSRYRAGNGALFTSSKCPPGAGLAQTCELPFGFLWSPLAATPDAVVIPYNNAHYTTGTTTDGEGGDEVSGIGLPPIICITCLAYLNMYANHDATTGKWICPLCGATNVAPIHDDGDSTSTSASADTQGEGLRVRVTEGEDDKLKRNRNNAAAAFCTKMLSSPIVEIHQNIAQNAFPGPSHHHHHHPPTNGTTSYTSSAVTGIPPDCLNIVLVLDRNLPRAEAQAVGTTMQRLLPTLLDGTPGDSKGPAALRTHPPPSPPSQNVNLGLVVFGGDVSIYQLGTMASSGMASADVFGGHEDLSEWHLDSRHYMTPVTASGGLDCLWRCLAAVYGVDANDPGNAASSTATSNSSHPMETKAPKSRLQILRERKQERLRKQKEAIEADEAPNSNMFVSSPLRNDNTNNLPRSPWDDALSVESSRSSTHATMMTTPDGDAAVYAAFQSHARPARRCTGEAIRCAFDLAVAGSEQAPRSARVFLFTNGCPNQGDGSVVSTLDSVEHNHHQSRSTSSGGTSRTMHPTVDTVQLTRAAEFFDLLGRSASERGVAVDVLCTGHLELGLPAYQALVDASAGYVLPHDSFGGGVHSQDHPHLAHNMEFLIKECSVSSIELKDGGSGTGDATSNGAGNTIHSATSYVGTTTIMDGCVVDLRMPSFINPTHLVGPAELLEGDTTLLPNERVAFTAGCALAAKRGLRTNHLPSKDMLDATLSRIRMGRVDPLSTLSVMLRFNDFFQNDHQSFFQFIVRYVNPTGNLLITRICTHRLATAKDVGEFLDTVDEEVVPVMLGKEAVYRSMHGRGEADDELERADPTRLEGLAHDAQSDLDATVHRISGAYRLLGLERGVRGMDLTEEGGIRAAGSSIDFAFPPELADSLRRLYHFRRGPFLSPGPMQSADDRAELRSLFMRLPLEDCLCMMALSLWTSGPLDQPMLPNDVVPVIGPPETLSLWDNVVIAGDHYNTLFVWSGRETADESFDSIRTQFTSFLAERSKRRFPMPKLHILKEGDSMSRRFLTLLAPSHGDPVDHQMAHFPALAHLSPEKLSQLRDKFRFYDPRVDASFRNWFWEVAGATSKSRDEGLSLCE